MTDESKEEMEDKSLIDEDESEEEELIESPFKRVLMVLFSPRLVFESMLANKKSKLDWIIPIVFTILCAFAMMIAGFEFLQNDQYEAAVTRIENSTKLSEEQKAERIEMMDTQMEASAGIQKKMAYIFTPIGVIVNLVIMAAVMMALVSIILKGTLTFSNALKIGALGSMASAVGTVVKLPLMFYHESMMNAKMSLGLLSPDSMADSFIVKLIDIDIFVLWFVIIISIGMSVYTKKSLRDALVPMVVLWFAFRLAATTLSSFIGGIGM